MDRAALARASEALPDSVPNRKDRVSSGPGVGRGRPGAALHPPGYWRRTPPILPLIACARSRLAFDRQRDPGTPKLICGPSCDDPSLAAMAISQLAVACITFIMRSALNDPAGQMKSGERGPTQRFRELVPGRLLGHSVLFYILPLFKREKQAEMLRHCRIVLQRDR